MNFIVKISLRNLLRQKRRNILLGTAIALGTAILIIAHGFSHGISDNLFNRIVVYVSGHIGVAFSENGNLNKQVFHDGPGIKEIIKREIPDIIKVEEGTWVFCRAVGNGKSDNIVMIGLDLDETGDEKTQQQDADNFKIIDGRFEDLGNNSMENPVFLAKEKAAFLNVKKGDVLRVRYRNINGQDQSARLTVAGIFLPANMFMTAPVFLELNNLKKLMGYASNDVGQLFITIKNPKKNAIKFAEKLHAALKPDLARIDGYLLNRNDSVPVTMLGYKTDSVSLALIRKNITADSKVDRNGCFIGDSLASALGIVPGTVCQISYKSKHQEKSPGSASIKATAVFSGGVLPGNVILLNDDEFYKVYYSGWPLKEKDSRWHSISSSNPLFPVLSEEWTLFPRAKTTDELARLQKEISSKKARGTSVDVRTMYESASAVLSLEYALHSITIVAVMVLFFIILIGVINTLRMTVRERTREIGTIRAIGMQKSDVMISFILETFFLTLFSSLTGTVLAFIAMKVLTMFRIDAAGNPVGMMLVNERLYFVPVLSSVILFICLIIAIAVVTAFFPARKAANLSAAEALRHFD